MEIAPVFENGEDFEVIRITRHYESFIVDLWFKSEDIMGMEISEDDIKEIGHVIGTDLEDIMRKTAITNGSASMKEIDIDYGLYFIKVRSVFFGREMIELKAADIDNVRNKIESDFSINAAKIVDEIASKKSIDTRKLQLIESDVFKTKK